MSVRLLAGGGNFGGTGLGTNYHIYSGICGTCRHGERRRHIGKSSGGWSFSFRGYRQPCDGEPPITSWMQWHEYLQSELADRHSEIRDEYGRTVSLDEFIAMVEQKKSSKHNHTLYCQTHHPDHARRECWLDEEGNSFCDNEFS